MPTDWDVNEKSEPIWGLLIHSAVVCQCNVSIDTGLAVLDTFPNPKNLELGRSFGRCRPNKEPNYANECRSFLPRVSKMPKCHSLDKLKCEKMLGGTYVCNLLINNSTPYDYLNCKSDGRIRSIASLYNLFVAAFPTSYSAKPAKCKQKR